MKYLLACLSQFSQKQVVTDLCLVDFLNTLFCVCEQTARGILNSKKPILKQKQTNHHERLNVCINSPKEQQFLEQMSSD